MEPALIIVLKEHQHDFVSVVPFDSSKDKLALFDFKSANQDIKQDVFAEFGIPSENGHWPPHLHFQIIKDRGEWEGDYPGVCKYSEREKYLNNSPDPDLVLQPINIYKFTSLIA